MPNEWSRTERVAESIRRELAPLLQGIAADRRLGLVTVTAVEVTPDLKFAKIFVSQIGGAGDEGRTLLEALDHELGRCRQAVARGLRLRVVPRLAFRYDATGARAAHLTELIGRPAAAGDDGHDDDGHGEPR